MTVYCVYRNDSDGCTYSCSWLIGVFLTNELAETELLKFTEAQASKQARKDEIEAERKVIIDRARAAMAQQIKVESVKVKGNDKQAQAALARKSKVEQNPNAEWIAFNERAQKECDAIGDVWSSKLDDYEIIPMETDQITP